jgi:hypothetical protein
MAIWSAARSLRSAAFLPTRIYPHTNIISAACEDLVRYADWTSRNGHLPGFPQQFLNLPLPHRFVQRGA